ncbi:H-NS histone family protein [Vibrio fortis]|uniref:H-NS histone family protein n=1 Tax=Vibrio fortis TaxID=212667 RepID=A0A5N3QTD6_9VIBR|nr:H-NS family nucleoid-associated regulatory protein [Vibrio fortis]KAB0285454.1 H-NS histone family protein [Vibrio fortis]
MTTLDQKTVDEAAKDMLGNLLRAKAFFRRLTLPQLEGFIDAAQEVVNDKKKEEAERIQREAKVIKKRTEVLNNIQKICDELGITYEEFMGQEAIQQHSSDKRAAAMNMVRYRCELFGKEYFWKGVGLPPKVFKAAMAQQSVTKGAFLMPESEHYSFDGKLDHSVPSEHAEEVEALVAKYEKSAKKK